MTSTLPKLNVLSPWKYYHYKISTNFLGNFKKDAVISIIKVACNPASKKTWFGFSLDINKVHPRLLWLVNYRKKLDLVS